MTEWTIIGGMIFGLSAIFVKDIPDKWVRYFIVACGPISWLVVAWCATGRILELIPKDKKQ